MSKWSTALVVVLLLLGPGGSSGVPAALPGKPAPARTGDSRKTRQVSAADAFYKQGAVQVVHLQVSEADLARLKAALPKRIYVPGTFRWGEQVLENVGVRYKGNSSSNPR